MNSLLKLREGRRDGGRDGSGRGIQKVDDDE